MGRRTKARECAMQMLYQWDMTREAMGRVAASFWKVRSSTPATQEMAERLALGAQRDLPEIDAAITAASKNWRFERLAPVDRTILRIAVYELLREVQTPSAVVMDEAVELAKRFSEADSPSFVNGVLDAVSRVLRPSEAKPRTGEQRDAKETRKGRS